MSNIESFLAEEWSKEMIRSWKYPENRLTKEEYMDNLKYIDRIKSNTTRYYSIMENVNEIVAVGMVEYIENEKPFISKVIVKFESRGKGYGGKLIEKILTEVETRPIWLRADLEKTPFYNKFGFIVTDSYVESMTVNPEHIHVHYIMKLE